MDVTLLKVTAILYLLASASFVVYIFLVRDFVSSLSPIILLIGFVVHTAALGVHFLQTGYPGVAQFREALSFYAWLLVAGYLLIQLKYRLAILGAIIAPLAFLMTLAAFAFGTGDAELPPGLKTYWLPIHVALAFLCNTLVPLVFACAS